MATKWLLCQLYKNDCSESRCLMVERGRTGRQCRKGTEVGGVLKRLQSATAYLIAQVPALLDNPDSQDLAPCQADDRLSTYWERWQKLYPTPHCSCWLWLLGPYFREWDFTNFKTNLSSHKLLRNRTWITMVTAKAGSGGGMHTLSQWQESRWKAKARERVLPIPQGCSVLPSVNALENVNSVSSQLPRPPLSILPHL